MGLENLKSVFAEGVGNSATLPEGRHGGDTGTILGQIPPNYSQLDNFQPFFQTSILSLTTGTNVEPAFPQNYTPLNTLINGEFQSDKTATGDILKNHGWFNLYNSNHTSLVIDQPSPPGENPFQPFLSGNPNIGDLNIRRNTSDNGSLGLSRGTEPYIVSRIGNHGRRLNRGGRLFPRDRAKTDFKRIGRYLKSPAGLLEIALKNAHFFIDEVVVRDRNKLINVRQRFNAGYNALSTLGATRLRLVGQGLPNILLDSGITKDYGHEVGSFLSPLERLADNGDIPSLAGGRTGAKNDRNKLGKPYDLYFLKDTFTDAKFDVTDEELPEKNIDRVEKIKKVTTGDKMTLASIGQGETLDTTTIDKTGYQGVGSDNSAPAAFNIDSSKEGMPLYFKDLRNDSYIFFRAYLEGITEDIAPSWAEHNYLGRSEPVYVYERAMRTINFTLKLVAQTEYELQAIYLKMNALTSMCYPEYAHDTRLGDKTRMKPPLAKFRLGEMFGSTNNEMLGFIEALNYTVPESSTWETVSGKRVAKHITATITWKVLHGTPPEMYKPGTDDEPYDFYGYNGVGLMPITNNKGQQTGQSTAGPIPPEKRRTRKWNSPRKTKPNGEPAG